jgi:photosystem II stability/assembly factor-like uncharacterized protein
MELMSRRQTWILLLCLLLLEEGNGRRALVHAAAQDRAPQEPARRTDGEGASVAPPKVPFGDRVALPVGIDTVTNRAGWTWHVTGPFGGDVTTLAIDPRNPERILAGTADGILFQSIDGGETWRSLQPGIESPGGTITTIHFDRAQKGRIYVGVNPIVSARDRMTGAPIGGVFISEDEGQSWQAVEALRGFAIRDLAQSASRPSTLVAAAFHGLFRTRNRGEEWERVTPEAHRDLRAGIHSAAIDPRDPDTLYVGTHHLPWKTTDGGSTWSLAGSAERGMIDDSDIFSIHLDETVPETVLMSACSGIYRSLDGSRRWTKFQGIPFSSRRTHHIFAHPTRPEQLFAATTEGLWVSLAGGVADSWRRVTPERLIVNRVAIHPARPDRVFLATEDQGILRSTDGGQTFTPSRNGFIHRQISALVADREVPGRVYAGVLFDQGESGFFLSIDGGLRWERSMAGLEAEDVYSIHQSPEVGKRLYVGTNRGLFRSDDRGRNWRRVERAPQASSPPTPAARPVRAAPTRAGSRTAQPRRTPIPPPAPAKIDLRHQVFSIVPLTPMADPAGTAPRGSVATTWLLASTWEGLFLSEEETQGWRRLPLTEPSRLSREPHIHTVITHPKLPGWILIGTDAGIFLSTNNGRSFIRKPTPDPLARIRRLAIHPGSPSALYAGTSAGFFRSFDGGETWEARGGGMPLQTDIGALLWEERAPHQLYVADDLRGTIYYSADAGANWEPFPLDQLPSRLVRTLIADPFDPGKLYLGTFSGGVYVVQRPPLPTTRPAGSVRRTGSHPLPNPLEHLTDLLGVRLPTRHLQVGFQLVRGAGQLILAQVPVEENLAPIGKGAPAQRDRPRDLLLSTLRVGRLAGEIGNAQLEMGHRVAVLKATTRLQLPNRLLVLALPDVEDS